MHGRMYIKMSKAVKFLIIFITIINNRIMKKSLENADAMKFYLKGEIRIIHKDDTY